MTKIGFHDRVSLNACQKYCRILEGEHSAVLSSFIKQPFAIRTFVLTIFEWPLKTRFTVYIAQSHKVANIIYSLYYVVNKSNTKPLIILQVCIGWIRHMAPQTTNTESQLFHAVLREYLYKIKEDIAVSVNIEQLQN